MLTEHGQGATVNFLAGGPKFSREYGILINSHKNIVILPLTAFTKLLTIKPFLKCKDFDTLFFNHLNLRGDTAWCRWQVTVPTFLVASGCRVCKVPSLQVPSLRGAEVSGIHRRCLLKIVVHLELLILYHSTLNDSLCGIVFF